MLYHREIFMPPKVANIKNASLPLLPTRHAEEAAAQDRYGRITIPARIEFNGSDIVEAEVIDGKTVKIVVRLKYDDTRDAIYVVALPDCRLKTVWFNLKSDFHGTLDRSRYASGPSK